jgi:uncharacterized membrane protein YedE/YeeE
MSRDRFLSIKQTIICNVVANVPSALLDAGGVPKQGEVPMVDFTPISAALGGLLIGFATLLLVLLNGRVAGISGIIGGAARASRDDLAWRGAFLAGLIAAALAYAAIGGSIPPVAITAPPAILVFGGLLVGFGSRLGNGCTSGHGVCGIARFSRRSLAATLVFMMVAGATVFVTRHVLGGA